MEKKTSSLLLAPNALPMVVVVLFVFMGDEAAAQVFCRSQFNLANEACSLRTFPGVNPAMPRPRRLLNESSSGGYELQAASGGDGHVGRSSGDHGTGGHGGHGTGSHGGHGGRHGAHGGHGSHRLGHHGGADPYDTACCRRLMGIDNACICQAMSFLPVFMSRVKHAIKLTPVPGCDVSFECAAIY